RDVSDATLALEEFGCHGIVALLGEAAGDVLDPLMHAPDLREHQEDRHAAARRRTGLVDRHCIIPDLDLGVSDDDPLGIGLDGLGESLVDSDRVAREGGSGDGHLVSSWMTMSRDERRRTALVAGAAYHTPPHPAKCGRAARC